MGGHLHAGQLAITFDHRPHRLGRQSPPLAAEAGPAAPVVVAQEERRVGVGALLDIRLNGEHGRLVQEDGRLVVEHTRRSAGEPALVALPASRPPNFGDGVIGIEAQLLTSGDQAGYALYLRRSPDNNSGYALWVRPRNRSLQLWREVKSARNELAQAQTEALLPDRANQVVLVVEGARFEAFVNGELVLTSSDATFASGRLGLAVGQISGGSPAEVRVAFEAFQVQSLR